MPSSSVAETNILWGTVFRGPSTDHETRLDLLRAKAESEQWSRRTEHEYMERVRARAAKEAEGILQEGQARSQRVREEAGKWIQEQQQLLATKEAEVAALKTEAEAIKAEAETIRREAQARFESASEQGFAHGMEQAADLVAQQHETQNRHLAKVLQSIQAQSVTLFEFWKHDLVQLLCQAVEAGTGWVLKRDKRDIMEHVLTQAVQQLENRQRLVVHANPEDASLLDELLAQSKERYDLRAWEVLSDAGMEPGGLVLESSSGKVDAGRCLRREVVEEALARLELPYSEADANARETVDQAFESPYAPTPSTDETLADNATEHEQNLPEQTLPEETSHEPVAQENALHLIPHDTGHELEPLQPLSEMVPADAPDIQQTIATLQPLEAVNILSPLPNGTPASDPSAMQTDMQRQAAPSASQPELVYDLSESQSIEAFEPLEPVEEEEL